MNNRQTGFTMIELIVTMIMIGILSAVAIPRMNLLSGFDEIGYRDQAVAALEFSRKAAVAQRRSVRVTRNGNELVFAIDNCHPEGATATPVCVPGTYPRDLLLPGSNLNLIRPRGATSLGGMTSVVFAPLGSATVTGGNLTITGESTVSVTIDTGTGYVSHN